MSSHTVKKKQKKINSGMDRTKSAADFICQIYLLCLLVIFPIMEHDQYNDILTVKSQFFRVSSGGFFVALGIVGIIAWIIIKRNHTVKRNKNKTAGLQVKRNLWQRMNLTDRFVLFFLIAISISFLLTPEKASSFWGTEGRRIGYLALAICCGIYFAVSNLCRLRKYLVYIAFAAASFIYVIAICNHLGYNPFNLCGTMEVNSQFISTLGNRNCMSAYTALFLSIAMAFFFALPWLSKRESAWFQEKNKKWLQMATFAFCILSFLAMAAAGSDSAFLACAIVFLVLLWQAFRSFAHLKRWSILGLMLCGALYLEKWMRYVRAEQCWKLDGILKVLFEQHLLEVLLFVMLVIFVVSVIGCKNMEKVAGDLQQNERCEHRLKIVRNVLFVAIVVGFVAVILFMIHISMTRTADEAKEVLGSMNNYLYFSDKWGTNRGTIWKSAWATFVGMPFAHQLFGYGPAMCRAAMELYDSTGGYASLNGVLVDAHNETLQYLVTTGIVGVAAYFGIFVTAIKQFAIKAKNSLAGVIGVCFVAAFFMQGFVNNTHLYIEPIAFVILALLVGMLRKEEKI